MKVKVVRVPEHVFAVLNETAALAGGLEMGDLMCAAASSFGCLDEDTKQWLIRDYWLMGVIENSKPSWKEKLYALARRAYSALRHADAS